MERILASVVGVALGGLGIWAVFRSDNQAGTAVLLVGAIACLLIAIQGTPLLRFGSGDHSVDFARRQERVKDVLQEAEEVDNPEVARAIVEAASTIEPALTSTYQANALGYEKAILNALERMNVRWTSPEASSPVDLVAITTESKGAPIIVEVRSAGRKLSRSDVVALEAVARSAGYSGPLVIVTNSPLSQSVGEFNGERARKGSSVEVVPWQDKRDDDLLGRAIAWAAR